MSTFHEIMYKYIVSKWFTLDINESGITALTYIHVYKCSYIKNVPVKLYELSPFCSELFLGQYIASGLSQY